MESLAATIFPGVASLTAHWRVSVSFAPGPATQKTAFRKQLSTGNHCFSRCFLPRRAL